MPNLYLPSDLPIELRRRLSSQTQRETSPVRWRSRPGRQ